MIERIVRGLIEELVMPYLKTNLDKINDLQKKNDAEFQSIRSLTIELRRELAAQRLWRNSLANPPVSTTTFVKGDRSSPVDLDTISVSSPYKERPSNLDQHDKNFTNVRPPRGFVESCAEEWGVSDDDAANLLGFDRD